MVNEVNEGSNRTLLKDGQVPASKVVDIITKKAIGLVEVDQNKESPPNIRIITSESTSDEEIVDLIGHLENVYK